MMDGAETLSEFMDVLTEAQVDGIYGEVQKALMAAEKSMPTANKVVGGYHAGELQNLINTVKTYGGSATLFAAPEFIAAMGPDAIVPAIAGAQGVLQLRRYRRYPQVRRYQTLPWYTCC
jgi:hypothetical protein